MDLAAHQDIQWLVLLTALGLLLFLASRLEHDNWTPVADHTPGETSGWNAGHFGPTLAGALVLLTVGLAQGLTYQTGSTPAHPDSLQQLADRYPGSHWLERGNAGSRSLSIPFSNTMNAVLIAPDSSTGRLRESALRPEDERIWRHTDTGRHLDCLGDNCITFVHTTWKRKGSNEARHTFYTYYVGDRMTESKFTFRLARGWNRLAGSTYPVGLIGFKLRGDMPPESVLSSAFHEMKGELHGTQVGGLASRVGNYYTLLCCHGNHFVLGNTAITPTILHQLLLGNF
jgi:hypothetical protein